MKNIFLKKFIVLLSLVFVLSVNNIVFAEDVPVDTSQVSIHLKIESDTTLYDNDINVSSCDSDNTGTLKITAYCAILQSGIPSVWDWSWAPGAFATSVGGISGYTSKDKDGMDVYHYWSWSLNGTDGTTGLNQYDLKTNDSILLTFIDPKTEIIPSVEIHSSEPASDSNNIIAGSGSTILEKSFSLPNAISFLSSQQKSDGSFGNSLYTDWVTIGIAKEGNDASELKNKLFNYLKQENFESSSITDYERHAMALMSLGINPYTDTNINYIEKIIDSFDGIQIGNKNLFNDDIFGLIVLNKAGYGENDEIIKNTIAFIISKQLPDGSWGSADMTSAGIQALKNFNGISGVADSISKAENYLVESQGKDGGFDNSSSTSWVLQSLSLDNSFSDNFDKGVRYLASKQKNDGGLDGDDINNRVWSTSYAIPAVLKLSWNDILESFQKPKEEATYNPTETFKTQNIKINTIKSTIKNKPIFTEGSAEGSSLGASAGNSNVNNDKFLSKVSRAISKIKSPFVWLWIKLGF